MQRLLEKTELPVIMAPMFLVTTPDMVINACKSGIIGSFPALNARSNHELIEWISTIKKELSLYEKNNPNKKVSPWAINFIAHRSNKRYEEDLETIKDLKPPIVITSLGDPSPIAQVVHGYGGIVLSDVINVKFAKKAIEKGSDGLILVAAGAGGHGGTYNPMPFIHEIREFWEGPVVLAGGISKAEDILASKILGADLVYMGSRFIASEESNAQVAYKEMLISSNIEDIYYTDVFSGVHANYLIPSIEKAGITLDQLSNEKITSKEMVGNPEVRAWKDIWGAGQSIGSISKIKSVSSIINTLKSDYHDLIKAYKTI